MNQPLKNCASCGRLLDETSLAKGRQQCPSCRRQTADKPLANQPPDKTATSAPVVQPKATPTSVPRVRGSEPLAAPTNLAKSHKNAPSQKVPDATASPTRRTAADSQGKGPLDSSPNLPGQQSDANHSTSAARVEPKVTKVSTASADEVPALHDLLPPKFLQPHLLQNATALRSHLRHKDSVVLPTADGGTVIVNQHVRVIEHDGTTVRLQSLPDPVRQQRRQIVNLIVIVVALIILLAAFWWLAQDL